jgi:prepilin-type N-terminal cleavage/methylation domain-containing protein
MLSALVKSAPSIDLLPRRLVTPKRLRAGGSLGEGGSPFPPSSFLLPTSRAFARSAFTLPTPRARFAFTLPEPRAPSAFTLPMPRARSAFTLIELMVVIGIISILMVLLVPAFNTIKGAGDITNVAYTVSGALENARTFAIANNTYAWVGFFEEDVANTPNINPRPAGTGRIIISIVASKEGTRYKDTLVDATTPHAFYPPPGPSPIAANDSNAVILTQVGKLIKVENAHLALLPATPSNRPAVGSEFQVAADEFALHPQSAIGSSPTLNPTTFNYPLGAVSPNIIYTFTKIIEFSPQGEAVKIVDLPTQLTEIGLQSTHGNAPDVNTPNVVAIQVASATGRTKIYRR